MKRGIRHNNPLNIRPSADRWEGMRMEQTDKSFVQFQSMAYGYRAAWKVLESYWKHFRQQRTVFTVKSIISRWAPPSENNTEAYVRAVLQLSGLGGEERLPRPFIGIALEKLGRLVAAMTCVECGMKFSEVPVDDMWAGYDLAFPGKRKKQCNWSTSYKPLDTQPFRIELPIESEAEPRNWDEYWDWSVTA